MGFLCFWQLFHFGKKSGQGKTGLFCPLVHWIQCFSAALLHSILLFQLFCLLYFESCSFVTCIGFKIAKFVRNNFDDPEKWPFSEQDTKKRQKCFPQFLTTIWVRSPPPILEASFHDRPESWIHSGLVWNLLKGQSCTFLLSLPWKNLYKLDFHTNRALPSCQILWEMGCCATSQSSKNFIQIKMVTLPYNSKADYHWNRASNSLKTPLYGKYKMSENPQQNVDACRAESLQLQINSTDLSITDLLLKSWSQCMEELQNAQPCNLLALAHCLPKVENCQPWNRNCWRSDTPTPMSHWQSEFHWVMIGLWLLTKFSQTFPSDFGC